MGSVPSLPESGEDTIVDEQAATDGHITASQNLEEYAQAFRAACTARKTLAVKLLYCDGKQEAAAPRLLSAEDVNAMMRVKYTGAAFKHNLKMAREHISRDAAIAKASAVAITLAAELGYANNALVIDRSNVNSDAHSGIRNDTPLSR
ncbi:unnamed protein product [Symbiodinium natans]|uniref:Uncharacterized protein n=1 Tax=Symbiodinium natans TaxID=878477 RepID=A0A812L999_9DINO|nr:unnamed protein product [Symbiodinium natans]